ncbi:transcriptional activator SPT7 [Arthroderma uncinatum]|uniref:transcriptional activator SPT7 n=1 Tax=Arthroderma uncinatum TaxID=74035 RepID=UPI00144ACDCD|nr:transcriptional activator SPT7 [Arthroderma uncinatum]KAF3491568.1 transcriptional activator SPT7 [Arthroderma uncinatum]
MSLNHHHTWLPPGHLRPPDDFYDTHSSVNGLSRTPSRPRTPQLRSRATLESMQSGTSISEMDPAPEEDPRIVAFRNSYQKSEARINYLFSGKRTSDNSLPSAESRDTNAVEDGPEPAQPELPAGPRKPARNLDEDDYDEYDDEGGSDSGAQGPSPPKSKSAPTPPEPKHAPQSPSRLPTQPSSAPENSKDAKKESAEDIRKRLEQDKKATEEAARQSFHTIFYTLENDRDAMLDQQRLEESERQVEAEMSSQNNTNNDSAAAQGSGHGTLSSANLGASSLTLKNLIARIDMKRHEVQASDAELRSLMSEVRKNRSKWASEEKIGQEELYEALEKVLSELKAQTEHSSAFLTKVNRRDAPDYVNIIKRPMDLGTMTKKLKAIQYKSKQEFVDDLNLIWANCLKYNANPEHFLRKHALYMRKETEKLVPLIPDIVIRDRAEVEAEERRLQLADLDGAEESDDEPIMSSRGRKAPGKKSKKGTTTARTAPETKSETTSVTDSRPQAQEAPLVRQESVLDGSQNDSSTPPPGTLTPLTLNNHGLTATQGDSMDIDCIGPPPAGQCSALLGLGSEFEDPEFKVWKLVTKKDRALVAAERHRLFKGDKLNPDEQALLRTKSGMRRWIRHRRATPGEQDKPEAAPSQAKEAEPSGETLAEGIEEEEDKMLPDYYDVMSVIPDLPENLHWVEDAEGNVVEHSEEFLRVLPSGSFTAPVSKFSKKMDANIRQMQETRKACSKISIVKQMQQQSQMYQNQFQKYQPERLIEQDIAPHVMNGEGPVINPWVCRAALQRSIGKILYHTGFEEYQPSALDAITDVASDFFCKIGQTLKSYMEAPKVPAVESSSEPAGTSEWKLPYTSEEMVLHTLQAVGTDVDALEAYVKEDVDRHGAKLSVIHDRLKNHLTELLRPAFADASGDGSGAFNDGSEQFVGGDFADDIDEDFFGFKELGLDKEFGLASLSVPLHLLQNRMFHAHQAQNANSTQSASDLFPTPPQYPKITLESIPSQIGLARNFFLAKLHANKDEPLIEDHELPPKQRPMAGRPRVPASGKIPPQPSQGIGSSPQKRPAPPASSISAKGIILEPSKKKAKKNVGLSVGMFSADGAADDSASTVTVPNNTMKGLMKSKLTDGSNGHVGMNGNANDTNGVASEQMGSQPLKGSA